MLPRLANIDFGQLTALEPWIGIIDPDHESHTLCLSSAGRGLSTLLGRDLVGYDYLDIVDDAIKGDAFDSAFLMLSRPCGLWQLTPATTTTGDKLLFEYTGIPVFDHLRGIGKIVVLIHRPFAKDAVVPRVASVQHASEWRWLDMREPLQT
ncbi:MAG: hypothetical protein K8S25_01950 [Alphaproteobacteria bacterium]|nr:hypothetical protein [Alphaproteobacteria bacterium]